MDPQGSGSGGSSDQETALRQEMANAYAQASVGGALTA